MSMGRCYISGPMTGKHLWNWPAFERAEKHLAAEGWEPISPARVDEDEGLVTVTRRPGFLHRGMVVEHVEVPEDFDFRVAIERDLELIDGCTAIYLLRGWEQSLGATIELDRAHRLGLSVLVEGGAATPAFLADKQPGDVDVAFATDRDEFPYLGVDHFAYLGDDDPPWEPTPVLTRLLSEDSILEHINAHARLVDSQIRSANGEVRVVDPETGGEKGSKLARFDLIPHEALTALAEHFGRGAEKYADRNWERGYDWALTFAALNRHLWAWWGGEDVDPETGSNHMTAVAWHAFVALTFQERSVGTDTRPTTPREVFDARPVTA